MALDGRALERLDRYLELLARWNGRINLTRVVAPREVVAKHFLDSLAMVPHLAGVATLIDVGSGAGFPGVVVAVARPDLQVTLVESVQKKAAFLEALRRELGLPLVVEARRLEKMEGGQSFGCAVSRATLAPAEWVERGAPLVAPGGLLIAMLGRDRPHLPAPRGFATGVWVDYELPVEGARALAIFRRGGLDAGTGEG